jgi:hypothetical protein
MFGVLVIVLRPDPIAGHGVSLGERQIPVPSQNFIRLKKLNDSRLSLFKPSSA